MKIALLSLSMVAVLLLVPSHTEALTCYAGTPEDGWCCETYPDSHPTAFANYGTACAYSGFGCTEGSDTQSGDSCTTNGPFCDIHRPEHRTEQ